MRHTMVGLAVAMAVAVSAAPASACGYSGCSAPSWNYNYSGFYGNYSAPVAPCMTACGGYAVAPTWGYGRLPYPAQPYATLPQYYYVNQGPTYTGPGAFAPYPTYREDAVVAPANYGYGYRAAVAPYHRPYYRPYRYGYGPRYGYLPRVHYGHGPRYGYAHRHAPYYGGHRVLRRYY